MRIAYYALISAFASVTPLDASANNCRFYTQRQTYSGMLQTTESKVIGEWRIPCDGAFNASAGKGRLTLLAEDGGRWREVKKASRPSFRGCLPGGIAWLWTIPTAFPWITGSASCMALADQASRCLP